MRVIKDFNVGMERLLGKQEFAANNRYRMFSYCVIVPEEQEILVCNLVTRKLISVSEKELGYLQNGICAEEMDDDARALAENWFLVPEEHDDYALCNEIRDMLSFLEQSQQSGTYSKYIIMTTLDCNARCFYCYQMGRGIKRIPMSEETALDVAKFIVKTASKKENHLLWYGGEPLYNDAVIDIICDHLRENGVPFSSTIITNGYLLTEDILHRAEKWNLKKAQIAIDGPEAVYNKCKAYIYKDDPSPYLRVLDNIGAALKAGWIISVRVNMDNHNVQQIYALADELADRFGQYEKFRIYAAGLYENAGPNNPKRDEELRMQLTDHLIEFEKYCVQKGLRISRKFSDAMKHVRCLADSPRAVTISPEGKLGKCDHTMGTDIFSDIYSEKKDEALLALWREQLNTKEKCGSCPLYPDCIRLKKCPDDGIAECTPSYVKLNLFHKSEEIRDAYRAEINQQKKKAE